MSKHVLQICAFCSKKKDDVNILITGDTGNICDTCVSQANNIIKENKRPDPVIYYYSNSAG